ncbi:MAG: Brp/Blh family beta-carotene 15,15'-dioxygenase [Taibaiella sp.]|nr:Brp/Blh family beta-carotene 15,15'-dioxygenase [Taibaiella sp.]
MTRSVFFIIGFITVVCQLIYLPIPEQTQHYLFFSGIILLGIPHGAADLLVAGRTAGEEKKSFSKMRFLTVYVSMLLAFGALLWFFPLLGGILFILLSAYHFGETDLNFVNVGSVLGKLLVTSYGILIISVILFSHFEEVKLLLEPFNIVLKNRGFINWLSEQRYYLMSFSVLIFFTSLFLYLFKNGVEVFLSKDRFLIGFASMVFILFNLPLLLGFTFYFVAWHSLFSLKNIVGYLRKSEDISPMLIVQKMLLYSSIAIGGIAIFGVASFFFFTGGSAVIYPFLGLAVLTAPHMLVMHDMYNRIRIDNLAVN